MICSADDLRRLFLFEQLDDGQLEWLCRTGQVESLEPGWVYREGEAATCFYVLMEGAVALYRRVGEDDIEINRTDQAGVYGGAFFSYLGDRAPQVYNNSMRATTTSRFYVLSADEFAGIVSNWFPMAVHLLDGLFFGVRNSQQVIGERERLLALGSLSAGLTHELNNPASAAVRATASLRTGVAGMRHKLAAMAAGQLDREALTSLVSLQEEAVSAVATAPALSPLATADREDELGAWLEDHGVAAGWEQAPNLVAAGLDLEYLERVATTVAASSHAHLGRAMAWINDTVETELLMREITDATTRVSNLVGAAKQYSQLDRAPWQTVDIHGLLESTLAILGQKLAGIEIVRQYDRSLPPIGVYAAELNQVWTNIIDNAAAVMSTGGTLTIRTANDDGQLLVEIGDTGPGIPEDIQPRIFEPFFTTKAFGEGTGLGLDISWRIVVNRHHGDIRVESMPGSTRFLVHLPFRDIPA
jgi:signal transduction histidine kinase